MATISYDIDSLKKAKKSIKKLKDSLNETNENLNTSMTELKEAWNTKAGKKFFKEHKDTWSVYVKNYTNKIKGIEDMLGSVISEYEEINEEVSKISF